VAEGALVVVAAAAAVIVAVLATGQDGLVVTTPPPGAASPSVAATDVPTPPVALGPGVVAEATARFSIVGDRSVEVGQRVLVVDGPVEHDGAPAFLLQHWGDLEHGLRPDSDFGWLSADMATQVLRPVTVACPADEPSLREVAALQVFERPLCFGDRPLTFGPVTASDYLVGTRTSRRWISDDGRPDFFTGLPIYADDPALDIPDGSWVSVTGHFDDPSSAGCGDAANIARCRQRFIVTAVETVEPPDFVLRGEWRSMALPPIGGRIGHVLAWTGSEMLVWGGRESTPEVSVFDGLKPRNGAAYDPVTDRWRRIPDAPISGRELPVSAWTGRELLVWGGLNGATSLADGAAYDPSTDRWRTLPAAPLGGQDAVGAWLAERFIIVTSDGAAAYDPITDRWELLEPAPIRRGWRSVAVGAGRLVLIAFGDGASGRVEGATYDPATGTWRVIDVPLEPLDAGVLPVEAGDLVLVPAAGKALDPVSGAWHDVRACRGAANGATWTGRYVVGTSAAYDVATDTCRDLPPSPARAAPFDETNGREFAVGVWTGADYLTWSGGTGGDTVWVPNDGVMFRPADVVVPG
jgi:hypothetical protein